MKELNYSEIITVSGGKTYSQQFSEEIVSFAVGSLGGLLAFSLVGATVPQLIGQAQLLPEGVALVGAPLLLTFVVGAPFGGVLLGSSVGLILWHAAHPEEL